MIEGVGSSFINAANKREAGADKDLFSDNADMYLSLFLTQLKNQNPSDAFDIKDMTQQLAQLNTSRQQIQMNENLETLIQYNEQSQLQSSLNMIGREVTYEGKDVYFDGQRRVSVGFDNEKNYEEVKVTIKNEEGLTVHEERIEKADLKPENNNFLWDGSNSQEDPKVGYYSVTVEGKVKGSRFAEIENTTVTGTVGAVDFSNGEPIISIGFDKSYKIDVPFGEVRTVSI
jgi:flagellar basal-body rod modification protein FlgD